MSANISIRNWESARDRGIVVPVYGNIYLSFLDFDQARQLSCQVELTGFRLVPSFDCERTCCGADENVMDYRMTSLGHIFRFDDMVKGIQGGCSGQKILFCTGPELFRQIRIAYLIGCHLIMAHGLGFEETYLAFNSMRGRDDLCLEGRTFVQTSLRAVCCSKCLNWIDFRAEDHSTSRIEMDEFIHYAR
jgi:hypothetical protein